MFWLLSDLMTLDQILYVMQHGEMQWRVSLALCLQPPAVKQAKQLPAREDVLLAETSHFLKHVGGANIGSF